MDENNSVLDMRSSERSGDDISAVKPFNFRYVSVINPSTYEPEKLKQLWARLQTQDYAFDDFTRGDIAVFAASMCELGSFHFEGRVGYAVIRNLYKCDNGYIHYVCWDRGSFKEMLNAAREIIDFAFTRLKVERLTAPVPAYNEQAKRLAIMLGFKFEGEMRNAILYRERHHNVSLFGMLRGDYERSALRR